MQPIEIIVIVLAVAIVLGVVVWSIVRKIQGKSSLGCDCDGCNGNCSQCKKVLEEVRKQKENQEK